MREAIKEDPSSDRRAPRGGCACCRVHSFHRFSQASLIAGTLPSKIIDLDPRREAASRRLSPQVSTIVSWGRGFGPAAEPSLGGSPNGYSPICAIVPTGVDNLPYVNCDTVRRAFSPISRQVRSQGPFAFDNCGLFSLSCGLGVLCSQI
jgi:hypothetical protein